MRSYVLICVVMAFTLVYVNTTLALVDTSLVLYFTFDEDEGNVVKDLSTYNNDGRIVGSPKQVEGKFGSALLFKGSPDTVEIPHSDSLNIAEAVTMEMWVNLKSDGSTDSQVGLEKGGWESGEYSLYAFYVPGNGMAVQFMDLPESCGDANSGHLGPNLKDDQWHHIAGTWDGKTISLYTDGVLDEAFECGGSLGTNKQSIYIGSRLASQRFLTGSVDEVRIYNRALTEAEIKKDMETFGGTAVAPMGKLADLWGRLKQI